MKMPEGRHRERRDANLSQLGRHHGSKVARLHLYADVEAPKMSLQVLQDGDVGHTWIALEWNDPTHVPDDIQGAHRTLLGEGGQYADPMGFWPDTKGIAHPDFDHMEVDDRGREYGVDKDGNPLGTGYSTNPFKSYVNGWMRHPDRAHEGQEKASQTWELTEEQAKAVIAYAESKRGAQYSVFFYNCTTFGVEAVKKAGQSPPSGGVGGVCFPNALYSSIKVRHKKGKGNTMVKKPTDSTKDGDFEDMEWERV
jgi:hypothetical protein